jgi:hypothetical protein
VVLPHGYSYGRLSLATAGRLLQPDSGVLVDLCRGRSTWSAAGQVAELAVRAAICDRDPEALTVSERGGAPVVSHVDGRRWRVSVIERTSADLRSASCGAVPKPAAFLEVGDVLPI